MGTAVLHPGSYCLFNTSSGECSGGLHVRRAHAQAARRSRRMSNPPLHSRRCLVVLHYAWRFIVWIGSFQKNQLSFEKRGQWLNVLRLDSSCHQLGNLYSPIHRKMGII